jgi:hypothetical protein
MFYFFQKGPEYLRCEIQALTDGSFELLISERDSNQRTEKYLTSQQANKRWHELQQQYKNDGWAGPFGRE